MSENDLTVYGAKLLINPSDYEITSPVVIDIETDERDNLVGIGLANSADAVSYFSSLPESLSRRLEQVQLVGHNLKGDVKWLRKWGCNIQSEQLLDDTMLMSYVISSTKESHGLKSLSKEILKREYPTYRQIVGKGKKKRTLDKHDVSVVAAYCGADVRCTFDLWQYFSNALTPVQRRIYHELEMPVMRLLFAMETTGMAVDREYLRTLQTQMESTTQLLETGLAQRGLANPRSPKQVKTWLTGQGVVVDSTDKSELQGHAEHDAVQLLLDYRASHKLLTTYVLPLLALSESDDRIHTQFNQVATDQIDDQWRGIRTGRLSSSSPNLQNIPSRSDTGRLIRRAFLPDKGLHLICADFEQIEYRLLAHFADDELLIKAFLDGRDVHEETGKAIGGDRKLGKNINFAAIYGAGADKVANLSKIARNEAERFLQTYWSRLPKVRRWIEGVKRQAYEQKGVTTLHGRWIPLPKIRSSLEFERWHWERAAVNYVIQGSAAEIMKMAMLRCIEQGFVPLLTVHDELLFNSSQPEVDKKSIEGIMSSVVTLKVPIIAKVGHGPNWKEAK